MKPSFIADPLREIAIRDLGLSGLSRADQDEILGSFGPVALEAAVLALIESLPKGKRGSFATLMQWDPPAAREFLEREAPEYESVIRTAVAYEVERFRLFLNAD